MAMMVAKAGPECHLQCTRNITPLLDSCIHELVKYLPNYAEMIQTLPRNIKDKILRLLCHRGQVTDEIVGKIIHTMTKSLDLSECEITDVALDKLKVCRNLRVLNLSACKTARTSISSPGLEAVFSHCPYLQGVYLRRCITVDDGAIVTLSEHCPHLKELNLGGCELLTDVSLEALGQNCPTLQSIQFSKTQVTDLGVYKLASGVCDQSLTEIMMDGCINLTDDAVETVVSCCPNITILNFYGCPCITDRSRQIVGGPNSKMKQLVWTIY